MDACKLVQVLYEKLLFINIIPEDPRSTNAKKTLQKILDIVKKAFDFLDEYASLPALGNQIAPTVS